MIEPHEVTRTDARWTVMGDRPMDDVLVIADFSGHVDVYGGAVSDVPSEFTQSVDAWLRDRGVGAKWA